MLCLCSESALQARAGLCFFGDPLLGSRMDEIFNLGRGVTPGQEKLALL